MRRAPHGAGGRRHQRLAALLLLLLAWALAGVFLGAGPAGAHAELVSVSPASGAALDEAPTELTLTFSESVTQVPGAMKLLAADGSTAELGRTTVQGNILRVPIPGPLADAGYVFVYRLISADSHPVAGATTFTVGETATAADAGAVAAAIGADTDWGVSNLGGLNRWGGYVGMVLLLGVPTFVVVCRRQLARSTGADPLLRGLTLAGAALVAVTALVSLPVQAARSSGSGLLEGVTEIDTVLQTTYGESVLARLALLALLLGALALALRHALALAVAGVAAVGLLVTFARSGHPAVGEHPWLTIAVDAVHFGAVAVWVGGLVVLGLRVLPQPPVDCRAVLARWSPLAMSAVTVLVITGSIQAWREVRSVAGFLDTSYGRWVLVKSLGLALLLALGEFGRRRVRVLAAHPRPATSASLGAALADPPPAAAQPSVPDGEGLAQLRRSVGLELALAAAVLAATAALVVTSPGGTSSGGQGEGSGRVGPADDLRAAGATGPARATVELPNDVVVEVVADPARAGSAVLTLTIRSLAVGSAGELVDPPEVSVTASLPEAGISPITLTSVRAEAGRFTVDAASMLLAGTWKITVTVRTTETDAGVGSVEIPLAPA